MSGGGTVRAGLAHLRAEWGRWWRAEDQTETHLAHIALNAQWRMWQRIRQRTASEVKANIGMLKQQQRMATAMQMQRMEAMKRGGHRGGYGGYGMMGGGGASPIISYRMMQWAQMQIKMGLIEFQPQPVTPGIMAAARDGIRRRRHWTAALTILVSVAAWTGLWTLSAPGALTVTAATALIVLLLAYAKGRNPRFRRAPVPKLLFVPPKEIPGTAMEEPEPEPFALTEAGRDPRRVREALHLALKPHQRKVEVSEIQTPEETYYGWKVPVVLKAGTAGQFLGILKDVAVKLRVGESRIMAQAESPEDAALITLRILTRDPFADPMPIPVRPPGSCSILGSCDFGLSIEGEKTPVMLAGQHVIIVADTGGGKTALVQRIAEYVTACHDAVIVDIDPVKRGLKVFAPLAAATARSPEEAETVLELLIQEAKRRINEMPATQNIWQPTAEHPAIVAVLDEFIKLSPRGKQMAAELLRNLGREALISIVIVTQDATEDVMGDAIADVPGVRIMLPCRTNDVPLVVGRPNAISLGWWPHLLVPSPDPGNPADAGRFYAITPQHRNPILRYASLLAPEEAARRVVERLDAPRPQLEFAARKQSEIPAIARLLLDAFATHSNPDALSLTQIAEHLAAVDPDTWTRWDHRKDRITMIGQEVRRQLKKAGLTVASGRIDSLPRRPSGYRLADIKESLS